MNKISKKIVSLVTMAAFAVTLVPAAAFAAPEDKTGYTVEQTAYNKATVNITLSDEDLAAVQADNDYNVVVWAEGANGVAEYDTVADYNVTAGATLSGQWEDAAVLNTLTGNDLSLEVTFTVGTNAADYDIYVAVNDDADEDGNTFQAIKEAKAAALTNADKTVEVDGAAFDKYSVYGKISGAAATNAEVTVDQELTTGFVVYDANHTATAAPFDKVWIWAEEEGVNGVSNFLVVKDADDKAADAVAYAINGASEATEPVVYFTKDGTYTLHAGVGDTLGEAMTNDLQGTTTVKVTAKNVVADKIENVVATIDNGGTQNITFTNNIGKLDLTGTNFAYDGIDDIVLTGKVVDENGRAVVGKTVTATTNKNSVVEFDNNAATDATDQYGEFSIPFQMQGRSNATVTLTVEGSDISYTIQITAAKATLDSIDRTLTGGNILAGTDTKYAASVYKNTPVYFTDAVQFKITDSEGEAVTRPLDKSEYKIDVRTVPDNPKATLSNNDLELVWDSAAGAYTLAYVGTDYKADLLEGKYEVRVALVGGEEDNATVTFNAVKFGKVQDTVLDIQARDYDQSPANPNEPIMNVDDTITLGQMIIVHAKYVDENGIKVPASSDVSFNFIGEAVSDWKDDNNRFATEPDIPANDSLIGTTVKVVAFNADKKQLVEKTLTVADSFTDKSLEFSSDNGAVSKDNKVTVSVVDANGKVQQVAGNIHAWVVDQSNEDAKVSVDTTNATVKSGKGSFTVYADQETTADIVVVVEAGSEAYYSTLEYTFGSEDALANRTVVMTIDSTEYVVNNKVFTGDAAPYIDNNWRTMVPIRALMEAFDAEVVWDEANPDVVTVNYDGDTQIVMNVGETGYSIDGVDGDMDTVPVNNNGRVYVPIRFVAEGIGFHVTPLYNANGLTASVVFQK